tara:strand:- start:135 stop:434 length:300 start_codon:yes stop_codon:yes gene_type:complete
MLRQLKRLFTRPVTLVPRDDFSEEDIRMAFSGLPEDSNVWKAVQAVIDEVLLDAVDEVSNPENAEKPGLLAYSAGRIETLAVLKRTLDDRRRGSRTRVD